MLKQNKNKTVVVNLGHQSEKKQSIYRHTYESINVRVHGSGIGHNCPGKLKVCPIVNTANILFFELYQHYYDSERKRKQYTQSNQSETFNPQFNILTFARLWDSFENLCQDQTEESWFQFQYLFQKKRKILYKKLSKNELKGYLSKLKPIYDELMNNWLNEEKFNFSECIKDWDNPDYLQKDDEITVIFQPPNSDNQFWQNNFDYWQFFDKYQNASFAFGQQKYREIRRQTKSAHKVRILVWILEDPDIDYQKELETINSLKEYGAEIKYLKSSESSKEYFKQEIKEGYDALIFIGHSKTEGTTGKFELKQGEFLTIEELNEVLKFAIEKGLRLAIFNSCDGMGLGNDLSKLHIDNVIVMKTDVINLVAEHFLRYFLKAFVEEKSSLPMAVKQAKKNLSEKLEPLGYPCVSELPILWINAGVKTPLSWDELRLGTIVHPDWGNAPDINAQNFWGREEEQEELKQWIVDDGCKVVTIEGLPGIGKTGLSVKVANSVEIQQEFDYIIWRSLLNLPKVDEILIDVINLLSNNQANILEDDLNLNKTINMLFDYLKDCRCLIILDNADTLLELDNNQKYKKGYEGYSKLFQSLAERTHQSCLLLTTRKEIPTFKLKTNNTESIRFKKIKGLANKDAKKIITSLEKYGNEIEGEDEDYEEIINYYEGNPLALNLIGRTVIEDFTGNLSEFIKQQKNRLLKQKTIYRDKLDSLVDWIVQTLSDEEKELMYWLSINLDPVSCQELSQDFINPKKEKEITKIVGSLENKITLSKSVENSLVSLQPVLIENMIAKLINEVVTEIQTGEINYFHRYALFKNSVKESIKDAQSNSILKPIYDKILPDDSEIIREIEKHQKSVPQKIAEIHQEYQQILTSLKKIKELESSNREKYFHNILSHIRANPSFHTGYAPGNLLNILLQYHHQEDFSDYNFSVLTIRHGYFLGRDLHNINFQNSTLKQCVFTQIFSDIYSLKISPIRQWLVFGDSQSQVKLWKLDTHEPEHSFPGHQDVVWSVDISSDEKYIASGSEDSTVKLWDLNERKLVETLKGHEQWVYSVAFSHDNKYLASASKDGKIILWDVNKRESIEIFSEHQDSVWSVAFSQDDKYLASGSEDGTIILWDVNKRESIKTFSEHQKAVRCVVFSPNGKYLASASEDKTIILWEVKDDNLVKKPSFGKHSNFVTSVAFSTDSKYLVSGGDDKIVSLWDVEEAQCIYRFSKHKSRVRTVAFTPDNQYIVSGAEDKTIRIWSVKDKKPVRMISGHTNQLLSVAFDPQGDWIASSSEKYKVKLWNLKTEKYIALQEHEDWVWSIAFSPDGKKLASVSEDEIVKIWDVEQQECIDDLEGHKNWIWTVAFHPQDNQILASAGADKAVIIWDLNERSPLHLPKVHTDDIWGISFSPDGHYLASASHDGTIGIWSVSREKLHCLLEEHTDGVWEVAFSPDGHYLASASKDLKVGIWDARNFQFIQFLEIENGHQYWVESVAFSPDSQTLVSIDNSHTILQWSLKEKKWVFEKILFKPDKEKPFLISRECRIAFSPTDQQMIAHSGYDQAITVRNVATGESFPLRPNRPYEKMNILGAKGLNNAQKRNLLALGAKEEDLNGLPKNPQQLVNQIKIRKMTVADIDTVIEIFAEVFSPEYISFGELTDGRAISPDIPCENIKDLFHQELLTGINDDKVEFFVATWEEGIAGFALTSIYSTPVGHQECWLDDLVVSPNYRGQGIGEKLVNTVIDWGREKNAKYFLLESSIHNEKAHNFFEKLGFQAMAKVFWKSAEDKNK